LIPVIFLTAANDLDERLQGFALGAVDYIGKPFHEAEVLARINVHLRAPMTPEARETDASEVLPPADVLHDEVLVRAAQKILRERIAHPPLLEDLARLLGSNRRQINEAFQTLCGQPAFGWLREERLRQAHHLVCRTDTPMSLIGEHLGYSTAANFARAFRERFGFSPRDLRRDMLTAQAKARAEHDI
jgi:transcriptional regulator GlxA family with amidase domain